MAGKRNRRSWGWVARQRSGRYLASYIGPDLARHYAGATYTSKLDAKAWAGGRAQAPNLSVLFRLGRKALEVSQRFMDAASR